MLDGLSGLSGLSALVNGSAVAAISNLVFWVSADNGVFQDTGRTTAASADGDPVGGWFDQSGRGNHPSQVTGGNKPLLKLNVRNGKPVLRFDGTNDYLSNSAAVPITTSTAFTMIAVVKAVSPMQGSSQDILFNGDSNSSNGYGLSIEQTTGNRQIVHRGVAGLTDSSMTTNQFELWTAIRDSAAPLDTLFANTVAQTVTNSTSAVNAPTLTTYLGTRDTVFNFLLGDVAEIVVYSKALSASERASVETYLMTKYGLPGFDFASSGSLQTSNTATTPLDSLDFSCWMNSMYVGAI